jgi:hypothetical protein
MNRYPNLSERTIDQIKSLLASVFFYISLFHSLCAISLLLFEVKRQNIHLFKKNKKKEKNEVALIVNDNRVTFIIMTARFFFLGFGFN